MNPIKIECWEGRPVNWEGRTRYPLDGLADRGLTLAFGGRELAGSSLLADVKVFALLFHMPGERAGPAPEHALLLAHVLDGLMGESLVACLSVEAKVEIIQRASPVLYVYPDLANWLLDKELAPRGLWHFSLVLPASIRRLSARRFFFECPRGLIYHYLQEYLVGIGENEFEGCVLDQALIPRLLEWNLRRREAALFSTIMDATLAMVATFAGNQGLIVLTRKFDFEEFKRRVRMDDLVRLAALMRADEQQPYWRMLEQMDRLAYHQKVEQFARAHRDIQPYLHEIETRDPDWVQQFREIWARLGQLYDIPLPSFADARVSMPGPAVSEVLNDLREMIRTRIALLQGRKKMSPSDAPPC